MTDQLQVWKEGFGKDYTDRNYVDWRIRIPLFNSILEGLSLDTILEVGCNSGHNLKTLQYILPKARVWGIEPNEYALDLAWEQGLNVLYGDASDLIFDNKYFDLVFTIGVLIHIPIEQLPTALEEIYRVSKKYILAMEYYSIVDTPITYRGRSELLWKRDFKNHYLTQFPYLKVIKRGVINMETLDRMNYWLFEKV